MTHRRLQRWLRPGGPAAEWSILNKRWLFDVVRVIGAVLIKYAVACRVVGAHVAAINVCTVLATRAIYRGDAHMNSIGC